MATELIDFSPLHDVWIQDEDGTCRPMDEPYFKFESIAPGTWKLLSDGDFYYLIEGDDEAILFDGGYGAGNVRKMCQQLTTKPLRYIVNSHDHFDHTANNAYFDCAFMAEESVPLATRPFPSFAGIDFPRDYPVQVVGDGYVFHLGNRDLEVIKIPDHAVGSIALLDRKERLLFSGDELGKPDSRQPLHGTVENFARNMRKLAAHRSEFDICCTGGQGLVPAEVVDRYLACAEYILAGHEGVQVDQTPRKRPEPVYVEGHLTFKRRDARPCDLPPNFGEPNPKQRVIEYGGTRLTYEVDKVFD